MTQQAANYNCSLFIKEAKAWWIYIMYPRSCNYNVSEMVSPSPKLLCLSILNFSLSQSSLTFPKSEFSLKSYPLKIYWVEWCFLRPTVWAALLFEKARCSVILRIIGLLPYHSKEMTAWFIFKISFASAVLPRSVFIAVMWKRKIRWGLKRSNVKFPFSHSNKGQQQIKRQDFLFGDWLAQTKARINARWIRCGDWCFKYVNLDTSERFNRQIGNRSFINTKADIRDHGDDNLGLSCFFLPTIFSELSTDTSWSKAHKWMRTISITELDHYASSPSSDSRARMYSSLHLMEIAQGNSVGYLLPWG